MKIKSLTEKDIQFWVAFNAKSYNPKSVRNQYGLVIAALKQERIKLEYNTITLPKPVKKEKSIPTEDEIHTILHMVEGTSIELPVTIAVTLGRSVISEYN